MRKICAVIAMVLILQMLCACGAKDEEITVPVQFYYGNRRISYNSPSGVIASETREGADFGDDVTKMLNQYLKGPKSAELQSLFPANTELIFCEILEDTAIVELNDGLSKLTGIKLTTACSGMLMTLHDCFGVQRITVYTNYGLQDSQTEFNLSLEDIVLADTVRTIE